MSVLVPLVVSVLAVAWLLWEPLADRMSRAMSRATCGYQPRHSVELIVKKRQDEEDAYQAVMDKVWIGYIADMAYRARARQGETWLLT